MRDECSSGIRSEAEEETAGDRPPRPGPRKAGLGSGPAHLSLSTTSSLSSCSNPSQARLVQSSLREARDSGTPPAPPPRTSSATSGSGDNGAGSGSGAGSVSGQELGKAGGGSKTTCMQCYLSGHSDGSLDSVDPSTEASSASAETGTGTLSVGRAQDREETSTREEKCNRFESGESGDQGAELQENKTND